MSINPMFTTKYIKEKYTDYLESILTVKDQDIYGKAKKKLEESNKFVKGPYIEITPPFVSGQSINELVDQGVLSGDFLKVKESLDPMRPLYMHQEKAVKKIVQDGRNMVVATGTGSGKTECFLIPVIDYLMKQKEQGILGPGVRALLLYPMNALANDQMKRLRELLKDYPDITFGRYTGETVKERNKALDVFKRLNPGAERLDNELLSREEMRENPPNILLTNYAMLEYLLLRPSDNAFFDGPYSDEWKFIVLDEAHSYKGANGTEISMLLGRLKERVAGGRKGVIKCIATSATLGGGKDDYPQVAEFASSLFGEDFYADDIVESKRINLVSVESNLSLREAGFYKKLDRDFEEVEGAGMKIGEFAHKYGISENVYSAMLHDILKKDARLAVLQKELGNGSKSLRDMAELVFKDCSGDGDFKVESLISLVNMAVKAKKSEKDMALLPARYHIFVKALEGMYVSLYPSKQVFLEHRERINITPSSHVPVFEFANCQKCGQEYIVGYIDADGYLRQTSSDFDDAEKKTAYYMITDEAENEEEAMNLDEDESTIYKSNIGKLEKWILCSACGKIEKAGRVSRIDCCSVKDSKKIVYLRKIKTHFSSNDVNTCPACGSVSPNIVKRFLAGNDPATNVLAKSLYEMIPPQGAKSGEERNREDSQGFEDDFFGDLGAEAAALLDVSKEDNTGRKLLIFSDNRQEAAFFAAYMNNKYNLVLWRKIILKALDTLKGEKDIRFDDLANRMVLEAEKGALFNNTISQVDKKRIAYSYLMKEFLSIERNTGLEGIGLLTIKPAACDAFRASYPRLQLNREEFWDLICVLFDSLRFSGAVTYPLSINPADDFFEPRNRAVYYRMEGSGNLRGTSILGLLPGDSFENKRSNFIKRILIKNGMDPKGARKEARDILKDIYTKMQGGFKKLQYIADENMGSEGIVSRLNYKMWNMSRTDDDAVIYRCKKCGKITNYNIRGICPEFRCEGELEEVKAAYSRKNEYFRSLYEEQKIIPMMAMEHTAQLKSSTASDLQTRFEKGEVNVLSCSTTFEMGVDVGQLEAIFMRNVPPETSNYIQRAGRAGRRTESTAFVMTYARRRSHDLNYFFAPEKIISGKMQPPYIEKYNDKIIRRHMNSIIFAYFFRKHVDYFDKVEDLFRFGLDESAVSLLRQELESHPEDLLKSIKLVVPEKLHRRFKLDEWGFVDDLCGENGSLLKAEMELKLTLENLEELKRRNFEKGSKVDYIQKIINTYLKRSVIDFLSAKNILPKYGFPVDVVELDVLNDCEEAHNIQLTRDLKMAITEFAPGSKIVAAGKVWTSYAVNMVNDKGWPTFEYAICPDCKRLYTAESNLDSSQESMIQDTCVCGRHLTNKKKFIMPIFGFSTSNHEPENPGENKPPRYYATKVSFADYGELDDNQKLEVSAGERSIGGKTVKYKYSPQGRLVLINQGINNRGFSICKYCGYAIPLTEKGDGEHYNKFGSKCPGKSLYSVDFGHEFTSDVLELRLPNMAGGGEELWLSLLYAILEGASTELDIIRSDINGCLYYNNESMNTPSIILFDEVAGGAGHVKKISGNIERVIRSAYEKVSGRCECGEETSCYGCLRSYSNQIYHDKLQRGLAKKYLEKLLGYEAGI